MCTASASPARPHARAVGCLALLAWLLNLYFYSGYYASDDIAYLEGIQRLAERRPIDPTDIAQMRLLLIAPAALIYRLFGSTALTILSYTLYHPLLVVLAYCLGCLAFDRRAALLGAALVAVSPVYYVYGGAILPDNCLSVWLAALLISALWTLREAQAGKLSRPRELACWLAVGGVTGLAYSAKEPGIVVAVPLAFTILIARLRAGARWGGLQSAVAYGFGVLGFVILETLVLRGLSGHWVVRLLGGAGSSETVEAFRERVTWQGILPLDRLLFWYSRSRDYLGAALWVVLAANLAALPLSRLRAEGAHERRFVPVLLVFWVWLFLYLSFGTTNFSHYLPPPLQHPRYFGVCLVPAYLITAAVFSWLTEQLEGRLGERQLWLRHPFRALPVALIVLWAGSRFLRFEPDSGDIYRAPQANAALAAFEDARLLYPKRPVLLSVYLRERLGALMQARGCSACDKILTHVDSMDELPRRPFLALSGARQNKDTFGPFLKSLERSKQIRLEPVGQGTYRAPQGRRGKLRAALYPLLGEFAEANWPLVSARHEVHLYLVSDGPAAAPR